MPYAALEKRPDDGLVLYVFDFPAFVVSFCFREIQG